MAVATPKLNITESQKQQYRDEGYFVLNNVIPPDHLELLREEAAHAIERCDKQMDEKGVDSLGLNHRGKRYFANHVWKVQPALREFLFADYMAEICRATIGPDAWLFWEQYVIKCADKGMKFSWHQDSGYVHPNHKPYVSCWCALDDVSEENGTVYILPQSTSGIRTWVQHEVDPISNDKVGYFGKERGVPVICPAGSIAVFSSLTFHSSGANTTNKMRRVYLAQYSGEVVMSEDGAKQWGDAEPFLKNNQNIATV
jgi:ectoine hydroxylase-related dioxygenase (phytanoyl-CoA dioxygenase family)